MPAKDRASGPKTCHAEAGDERDQSVAVNIFSLSGMVMNDQGALIGRFIDQELNGAVRSVLEGVFEERLRSKTI